ncbi:mycothiol synthase [Streptomyces sp. 8L]|uniref:mycothiol synthase n=1 Tax=Streptomyces sp. 8L TaxID=2877242 RepID=UPI001CD66D96|nr:mycothiol synthase [Streptomyces sp. 8L]MCA1222353.1 mycothiol synthase [Streptomyces sp. 8L]
MTDAAAREPARQIQTLDALTDEQAGSVLALLAEAAAADGTQAVSEQGRLQLRGGHREGVRHLLLTAGGEVLGYAQLEDTDPVEAPAAELVVHPSWGGGGPARRGGRGGGGGGGGGGRGVGGGGAGGAPPGPPPARGAPPGAPRAAPPPPRAGPPPPALGDALMAASGRRLRVWAHGGKSGARHLAQVLGLTLFRELRQMRRPLAPLDIPDPQIPAGVAIRTFVPGEDDAAWLALNAAAFAHHPEQGGMTQRDLDDRIAEPWFDPKGFFLAERAGELIGFHWTKVHAEERLGEVYVVGVSPDAQGGGLGKTLTAIGLRHLAAEGLPTAMLYVDGDNTAAVRVYEGLGFTTHETDLMYRTEL